MKYFYPCPKCEELIEYDICPPDPSAGIKGYDLSGDCSYCDYEPTNQDLDIVLENMLRDEEECKMENKEEDYL